MAADVNHPAHRISLNELGSLVIDVSGNRLDAKFLTAAGDIHDHYTLLKSQPFLAAPLDLVARPASASDLNLSWTPGSSNHLGYSIERSLDGLNFTERFTLPASATSVLDTGLLANATYFYRVRATNNTEVSDYSNLASATTVAPVSLPAAPATLTIGADNGADHYRSQMLLRWQDRSTNEAGFQIERSLDGFTFVAVSTVGQTCCTIWITIWLPAPSTTIACAASTRSACPPQPAPPPM